MAWITPTETDLQGLLLSQEMSALKNYLSAGQTNPLPALVAQATNTARGYIAAGGAALGPAGSVPAELLQATLTLARHYVLTRIPRDNLLTEGRLREYQEATRMLREAGQGKFAFESSSGSVAAPTGPSARITAKAASAL